MKRQAQRADTSNDMGERHDRTTPTPFVGLDGFAMLGLSFLVMAATGGITLLACLAYIIRVGMNASTTPPDYADLLIFGFRQRQDQSPEAVYRQRLDRAAILLRERTNAVAILLGGRPHFGLRSEAAIGTAYLLSAGIASARIYREDGSRHTLENLRHYRDAFPDRMKMPVAFVSSRFHLARVASMARALGLRGGMCAAESSRLAAIQRPDRLLIEALMLHWYIVGRGFSHLVNNKRMLSRIS